MSDQGKPRRVLKIVCSRCGERWDPTHLGRQCPKEQSTEDAPPKDNRAFRGCVRAGGKTPSTPPPKNAPPRDAGGRMIDQQLWESFEESR